MNKYVTRTLFATAMLALILNNGIDIWRKLRPTKVKSVEPVAALPDAHELNQVKSLSAAKVLA